MEIHPTAGREQSQPTTLGGNQPTYASGDGSNPLDSLLCTFISEHLSAKQISAVYNFSGCNQMQASMCLCEEPTLTSILQMVNKRLQEFPKKKVSVDFDDVWDDTIALYKVPAFGPKCQLKISINGQAAIDIRGVR